jgi:hypothetical protein
MALRVDWSDEARADVRAFDRPTAMRIFDGVLRFVRTGRGDVQEIKGDAAGTGCASVTIVHSLRMSLGEFESTG